MFMLRNFKIFKLFNFKKIKTVKFLSLILLPFLLVTQSYANDSDKIINKFFKVESYKSSFSQKIIDAKGTVVQTNIGTMSLLRPNNFKMEVTEPEESLVVADGNSVYYYDAMLEQVSIYDFKNIVAESPLILIMTKDNAVWDKYNVKEISDTEFEIIPKTEGLISNIVIKFNGDLISSILIKEKDGKQNYYQFTIDNNANLSEDDFKYSIPKGVEIDDQR